MSISLRRIIGDLVKINQGNHPEYSIRPIDSDNLYEMHGNLLIQEGAYQGLLIHLIIKLPTSYPYEAPKIFLGSGFPLTHRFHEHIYETPDGLELCNDLVANFSTYFQETTPKGEQSSRWTPGTTLESLIISMFPFFAHPDLTPAEEPSEAELNLLRIKIGEYSCPDCPHTTEIPWPPLGGTNPQPEKEDDSNKSNQLKPGFKLHRCGITKLTRVKDNTLIFGYPLQRSGQSSVLKPLPELISFRAWQDDETKLLKTPNGQIYHYWVPIYLNQKHWSDLTPRQEEINKAMDKIPSFHSGFSEMADLIIRLLHQSVIDLNELSTDTNPTEDFYQMQLHLGRTLFQLTKDHPSLIATWNRQTVHFLQTPAARNKSDIPHYGYFLPLYFLTNQPYSKRDQQILLFERLVRQVKWLWREGSYNFLSTHAAKQVNKALQLGLTQYRQYAWTVNFYQEIFPTLGELENQSTEKQCKLLQTLNLSISRLDNHYDFFKMARISFITSSFDLYNLLNLAVFESNRRHYTNIRLQKPEDYYMI